jgi:hypothetical protein
MLIALHTQPPGFIVSEGEVLAATLIAVDLSDEQPMVALAQYDGSVTTYMAEFFYLDREDAERYADSETEPDDSDDLCETCAALERTNVLFDAANAMRA